jgi:AcrR family transcriptional regulator
MRFTVGIEAPAKADWCNGGSAAGRVRDTVAAVQPTSAPSRGGGRAQATRATLLSAAREVFAESGFAEANIADVVARAGASVGSLYHHFGGKADLYLALFEDYQSRQEEGAATAVRAARQTGITDPAELFLVGAGAYLRGCWQERELARMFLAGGGPPGFELIARRRYREWTRVNAALLQAEEQPLGDTLVLVLTSVVAEAGSEVAVQDDEQTAYRLADEVLEMIGRISSPR